MEENIKISQIRHIRLIYPIFGIPEFFFKLINLHKLLINFQNYLII